MDLDDEEVPVEGLGSLRPDTSAVTLTLQSCDTGLAEPFDLTVPIPLFYGTVDPARIATKLVDKHNVPVYLYPSTEALLTACVDRRWQDCRDNYFDAALESSGRQDNANAWAEFFTKVLVDTTEGSKRGGGTDRGKEMLFFWFLFFLIGVTAHAKQPVLRG
eukprot:m.10563 g.10563  ORF g.10563 m.10563 type:complete len:161 (+) comp3813_c0_seq2:187-669(+)